MLPSQRLVHWTEAVDPAIATRTTSLQIKHQRTSRDNFRHWLVNEREYSCGGLLVLFALPYEFCPIHLIDW